VKTSDSKGDATNGCEYVQSPRADLVVSTNLLNYVCEVMLVKTSDSKGDATNGCEYVRSPRADSVVSTKLTELCL
jgi:predicted nucleic acid-binding protein